MTLATCGVAIAEAEAVGDPDLPWLDNRWYKINLDVRARIELADIDGFGNSEAYTLRTRVGLEAKPYYGFSALAELENTWSPASGDYFDGASTPNGKSVIADPENTELNRIWAQYAEHKFLGTSVSIKAKGGIQRIIFDDARFIGRSDGSSGSDAFIWDATNGMRTVVQELAAKGVELPSGWTLTSAQAISSDGTTIVGAGRNPSGRTEAWLAVVTVPEPGTASLEIAVVLTLAVMKRRSVRAQ